MQYPTGERPPSNPVRLRRTIRARMTAGLTCFVAVIMLISSLAVQAHVRSLAEQRTAETLQVAVERADFEWQAPGRGSRASLLTTTRRNADEIAAGGLVLVVIDADGRILWQSSKNAPSWPSPGPGWRTASLTRGGQTLILGRAWQYVERGLVATATALAMLSILSVATAALGSWFVVGRTLSPIDDLAQQASAASAVNLQVSLQAPSTDAEIVRLTETINGLLERVGQEAKVQSRFYAAAAHELRTPLQALQGHLDVALSRARPAEEYVAALTEAQAQTERLTRVIQDLLQLNALGSGASHPQEETVNAADVVERVLKQFKAHICARELSVGAELPDLTISVPMMHFEIVSRNLIENAVKYAPGATDVQVRLEANSQAPGWRFSVVNQCAVAATTDLNLWLEPFFRPDSSRYSATGGNGLGLAIVKAVCEANGWGISLRHQQGRISATVSCPGSHMM